MSLQNDIFEWVRRLEPWKQELYLRAAVSPQIGEQDIREVTAMLLCDAAGATGPRKVSRDDFPGADGESERMYVRSLSDLVNVNQLADGQTLAFEPHGLNIVYGKNGAGKTGYSRILKHAGRTLRRETVLANVGKPGGPPPSATVTVAIGATEHRVQLDLEAPPPAMLARICIADSLGGEEYLTSDTEVDYAPAVLNSLDRLAKGLKAVAVELDRRLDAVRPTPLDLTPFGTATRISRLLAALSSTTADQEIVELSNLTDEEHDELAGLRRKRGEIEARHAPRLRKAAEREAEVSLQLASDLRLLARQLGVESTETARIRHKALVEARHAAELAAATFNAEPITGVGSGPWRVLWDAARTFVQHQGQELPPAHEHASCPLCMQELTPAARERLKRFDAFVKDDISKRVRDAERAVTAGHDSLPDLDAFRLRHGETIKLLDTASDALGQYVRTWLDSAQSTLVCLRADSFEDLQPLVTPPVERIEAWSAARSNEAAQHAALENADERRALEAALAELEAREELHHRHSEILGHLGALREVDRLTRAKAKTGTGSVSTKITTLSRELIEADLQGALTHQLRGLDFHGLAVYTRPKTVRGKSMVTLRFKTVDDVPLTSVLSQGEQRRLALAMFLAEMAVLSDRNPIVLDDPVSSIDQEGRRHIARTLSELARDRQVVVFTHELSFVHELRRQAPPDLPVHLQHVRRIGKFAGHVQDGLPWEGLKANQRRQKLNETLGEARRLYEASELDSYRRVLIEFCALLRSSFERAVEEKVLAEVVTRRDDAVRTTNLRRVNCSEEVCRLVDRGVDDCSPWVHDQPLSDGTNPPSPDELREGLDVFEELLDTLKSADKDRQQPVSSNLSVVESESSPGVIAVRAGALSQGRV